MKKLVRFYISFAIFWLVPFFALVAQESITIDGFTQHWDKTYPELSGKKLRRTVQVGDYIVILAHDDNRNPYLYAINHFTEDIVQLSTDGIIASDPQNAGDYLSLSDIGVTTDNHLVGCNYIRTFHGQHWDSKTIPNGYEGGELRFYKWETITSDPKLWIKRSRAPWDAVSNYHVGNFLIADVGYTLAVDGPSTNCVLTTTAVENYQNDDTRPRLRYTHITVKNDAIASGTYSRSGLSVKEQNEFLDVTNRYGNGVQDYRISKSPLGLKRWVIDGTSTTAAEFTQKDGNREYNSINGRIPESNFGVKAIETNYVKYTREKDSQTHNFVVAPYFNENDEVMGVRVCDITTSFESAIPVTTNTDLKTPTTATYTASSTQMDGSDMHLFLVMDNRVVKFSTLAKGQMPEGTADCGIYAYGLNVTDNGDYTYDFTFTCNDVPHLGTDIIFYKDGEEVGRIKEPVVAKGSNTFRIKSWDLPGEIGDTLTWAVEVNNYPVREFGMIGTPHTMHSSNQRLHATVDNSPESPYMGRIYLEERTAAGTGYVFVYNADYTPYEANNDGEGKGRNVGQTWNSVGRPSVDAEGYVWLADFGDSHGGVYVMDPATLTATSFFVGSQTHKGTNGNISGIWTNSSSQAMGSSTSGCFVYGSGVDAKLFAMNEDAYTSSTPNLYGSGYNIYNIGAASGNVHTWNKVPSQTVAVTNNQGTNFSIVGTSRGAWLCQHISATASDNRASLMFYNNAGERKYCSYGDATNFPQQVSPGGGLAVSPKENRLAVVDSDGDIKLFRITWSGDVPTLDLIKEYDTGYDAIGTLNFDYAGNLIATVGSTYGVNNSNMKLVVYALPTEDIGKGSNTTTTPARKALTVRKYSEDVVEAAKNVKGWGIYAYDLNVEHADDNSNHTFSFRVNEYATFARLVFYNPDNSVMGYYPLERLPRPDKINEYTISSADIPRLHPRLQQTLRWGVEVESKQIAERKKLKYDYTTYTRAFNAVDNSPESDYFGRIYVMNYVGSEGNAGVGTAVNGAFYYDQMWKLQNPTRLRGGESLWRNPQRFTVDSKGTIYFAEWGYNHSGIFMANPADIEGESWTQFFKGSRTTNTGIITNGSFVTGGCTSSAFIYGTGENTKLYMFNEYEGGTLTQSGVVVYDIGVWDDQKQWETKPSTVISTGDTYNARGYEGNLWVTSRGFFLALNNDKSSDNAINKTGRPSLVFFDNSGTRQFSSAVDTYDDGTNPTHAFSAGLSGSKGGGFAVNKDENLLVINDGTNNSGGNLMVFDITWEGNKPKFKLREQDITHGLEDVRQMNFDYAGNLILSGKGGLEVWSFPTGKNNRRTTPAQKAKVVVLPGYDAVFTGGKDNNKWSEGGNWLKAGDARSMPTNTSSPTTMDKVLIEAGCNVDGEAVAKNIDIASGAVLTINPTGSLTVTETIQEESVAATDDEDNMYMQRTMHDANQLVLQASADGQAVLIHHDKEGVTPATVQIYGATTDNPLAWEQIAVPFGYTEAADIFIYTWMYKWLESACDWSLMNGWGHPLELFHGYLLTQPTPKTYTMQGNLQPSTEQTIDLRFAGTGDLKGFNFLGNSWTAPLQISAFVDRDFVNTEASIYLYENKQYNANPVYQKIGEGTKIIKPLQAFFVKATDAGARLTLNYDRLVNKAVSQNASRRAPAPLQDKLHITVTGSAGETDQLYIFESNSYTHEFDQGYEATKLEGDEGMPYLTATTVLGEMAVLATPQIEGTFLNFRQGTSATYTFAFTYDGITDLYLEDAIANQAVAIQTGATYTFTASENDAHRFRIIRKSEGSDVATSELNVWAEDDNLFVDNPTGERMEICVYSADGKVVQRIISSEHITKLDVPANGVYTIQITTNNHVQTIKHIL